MCVCVYVFTFSFRLLKVNNFVSLGSIQSSWCFIDITIIIEMNSCTHCETRSSCFFTTLVAVAVVVAAAAAVAGAVVVSFQFVLNTLPVDGFTLVFLGTKSKQTCSSWHFNSNEEEFKSIIKTIPTATKTHSESRRRKKRHYLSNWKRADFFKQSWDQNLFPLCCYNYI